MTPQCLARQKPPSPWSQALTPARRAICMQDRLSNCWQTLLPHSQQANFVRLQLPTS